MYYIEIKTSQVRHRPVVPTNNRAKLYAICINNYNNILRFIEEKKRKLY